MLVLSRKVNEEIWIGDDIKIMVVSIDGHKVRLGIDAPKNVSVHRKEVYEAIQNGRPPVAEAACDVKGLASADYESTLYQQGEDDQPLQDKLNDELEGR